MLKPFVVTFLTGMAVFTAGANEFESDGLRFRILDEDPGAVCLLGASGWSASYSIPAQVNGYTVKQIGPNALSWVTVTDVPPTLEILHDEALVGVTFKSEADLQHLRHIGARALSHATFERDALCFSNTDLYVGPYAFRDSNLKSLKILSCNNAVLDDYAFSNCRSLQTAELYCKTIGNRSFWQADGLKNLVVGPYVESVGVQAFDDDLNLNSLLVGIRFEEGEGEYAVEIGNKIYSPLIPACKTHAFYNVGWQRSNPNLVLHSDVNPLSPLVSWSIPCVDVMVCPFIENEEGMLVYLSDSQVYAAAYAALRDSESEADAEALVASHINPEKNLYLHQGWDRDYFRAYYFYTNPADDSVATSDQPLADGNHTQERPHAGNFVYRPFDNGSLSFVIDREELPVPDITQSVHEISASHSRSDVRVEGTDIVVTGNAPVSIYDIEGHHIYSGHASRVSVTPGFYIVKISGEAVKLIVR